jgi:hypothetical protein
MTSSAEVPVRVSALEVPLMVQGSVVVNDHARSSARGLAEESFTPFVPPLMVAV